jgi:hypothetical protein
MADIAGIFELREWILLTNFMSKVTVKKWTSYFLFWTYFLGTNEKVNTIGKKMIVGKLIVFTVTYIFYVHHSNIS